MENSLRAIFDKLPCTIVQDKEAEHYAKVLQCA